MNRIFGFTVACAMALVMAGCSSGGGGKMMEKLPPPEPIPMVFNSKAYSPMSMAVERDQFEPGLSVSDDVSNENVYVKSIARGADADADVNRDPRGDVRVTYVVGGVEKTIHFTEEDYLSDTTARKVVDGISHLIFDHRLTLGDETTDYLDVNGWLYHDGANELSYWGYAVHGEQTPISRMPVVGSAKYSGIMRGDMWESGKPGSGDVIRVRGVIKFNVNFADNSLGGNIDTIRFRAGNAREFTPIAETNMIMISDGKISENGFSASWTGHDSEDGRNSEDTFYGFAGEMTGGFYGPDAVELGGVMRGTRSATASTAERVLVSGFGAKKK